MYYKRYQILTLETVVELEIDSKDIGGDLKLWEIF